jgi:ERCC4-related helicase
MPLDVHTSATFACALKQVHASQLYQLKPITQPDVVVAVFLFRSKSGSRLLVATDAAAEGIDVRECSLVVSYSSSTTGIKRVQRRGRCRTQDGKFLTIVLQSKDNCLGIQDEMLHQKSMLEEANMMEYLQNGPPEAKN